MVMRGVVHLVVHRVVVIMVMNVMMNMMHRSGHGRGGVFSKGVTGEAERNHGGGGNGLYHGSVFLNLMKPQRAIRDHKGLCMNSR